jgi:hypothetical protein
VVVVLYVITVTARKDIILFDINSASLAGGDGKGVGRECLLQLYFTEGNLKTMKY